MAEWPVKGRPRALSCFPVKVGWEALPAGSKTNPESSSHNIEKYQERMSKMSLKHGLPSIPKRCYHRRRIHRMGCQNNFEARKPYSLNLTYAYDPWHITAIAPRYGTSQKSNCHKRPRSQENVAMLEPLSHVTRP